MHTINFRRLNENTCEICGFSDSLAHQPFSKEACRVNFVKVFAKQVSWKIYGQGNLLG